MGFGLVIGFTELLQIVTANNYSIFANLHTLQFTTAHAVSSSVFSASVLTFTMHPKFWVNKPHIINYYSSGDWNAFVLGLMYILGKETGLGMVAPGIFQDRNVNLFPSVAFQHSNRSDHLFVIQCNVTYAVNIVLLNGPRNKRIFNSYQTWQ
jgi:hypothetical protein